jgi:hypothetical protein
MFCVLLTAFSHHQHNIRSSPAHFSAALVLDHQHPPTMNPPGNHRAGNGPEAFVLAGKDIQRKSPRIGAVATEDRVFRKFFGITAVIASTLWRLLAANDKIPAKPGIKHLLWMLHFLSTHPKQGAACSMVGGLERAVDPKTLRKYIWPLIYAVSDTEPDVVSVFTVRANVQLN